MHRLWGIWWLLMSSSMPALAAPTTDVCADCTLQCVVAAARTQIGVTVGYDSSYQRLPYPNGDVAATGGVCTDVLIRAYRGVGVDLQERVHEDMRAHFSKYPPLWRLSGPDSNIDHRRVPNLAKFFARFGEVKAADAADVDFSAGDIVTWRLPSGVPHIGIVSDRVGASGAPLIVHNIGRGAVEEDMLHVFTITGHYAYRPAALERSPMCRVAAHRDR
jgi:uncharacterized protein YijF (DUF1287 family)